MPRFSALRLAALADLAEQLRYAPKATASRQLDRAVELAGVLDADRNYPEDWVVERITGYRPDIEDPATLVGEALLRELSAFVERVSDGAGLTPDDLPPDSIRIDTLASRWGVSRRTVERYRRQGLVAHRVRDDRNQATLLVTPDAARSFEARRRGDLDRAASFSRLDQATERRLARLGARAARRFGWSLAETARRLAERIDRRPETVRQALLRAPESAAAFGAAPGRLSTREREVILRADRRGVPVRRIAERFDRTPSSIRRLTLEIRAERLRSLDLPSGGAEAAALEAPIAREGLLVEPDRTLDALLAGARADGPPNAAAERALGAAQRAALARAGSIAQGLPNAAPPAPLVDRAETDLRWAAMLRARLVQLQRRTILQAIEDALGSELGALPPSPARAAHRRAMDAAVAAAGAFDPSRGGRLAAPIVVAVQRALAGVATARAPIGSARATARTVRLDDWTRRLAPWQRWLGPPASACDRLAVLSEDDRRLVTIRFGLDGAAPRTLAEAAAQLGGSARGAARRERIALRTLFRAPGEGHG